MMVLVMMSLELDWVTHGFINEHPPALWLTSQFI